METRLLNSYACDENGEELEADELELLDAVTEVARDSWEAARETEYELV